ncbi:MATE family efflux transporter [Mycoplasmatota bacterium WC44]
MTIDEKKSHLILKDNNIYKGLLVLSLPLMLNNLLKSLHGIVDMIFVSDLGDGAISSISLTWSMIFIFLSFSFGVGAAGTAIISQYLGANNKKMAKKTSGQLLIIAITLSVLFNVILYIMAPFLLRISGAQGFVYENAVKYLRIRSFEMLPVFVFTVYTSVRQAGGDTVTPVILNTVAVIINIALSGLFIKVLGFGVPGAGIATIISNYLVFPVSIYYLFISKSGVTITLSDLKLDFRVIGELLKIAIPSSFANAVTSVGFMIMNAIIIREFGAVTLDAFGVGNRINALTLLPIMSISTVLSTYIGQNVGAQNSTRAKLVFKKATSFTLFVAVLGIIVVMPFRGVIISAFLKNQDSLELCKTYLFYLTLTLPFFGIFQLLLGVFRGLGHVKYILILSLSRLWLFRLPMITIMIYILNFKESGLWHAMWISNIIAVILGYYLYNRTKFVPRIRVEDGSIS